jgi:hypothetical protein
MTPSPSQRQRSRAMAASQQPAEGRRDGWPGWRAEVAGPLAGWPELAPAEREAARSAAGQLPRGEVEARPAPEAGPLPAAARRGLQAASRPLDPAARASLEPALGADLSGVRVHDTSAAAMAADELGARAYTVGKDVVFGAGQYRPGTEQGDRLLRHELTHVAQQEQGPGAPAPADGARALSLDSTPPGGNRAGGGGSSGGGGASLGLGGPAGLGASTGEVVELKGKTYFSPSPALARQIQDRAGAVVWVSVRFGSLASNEIPVRWNGKGAGPASVETAPPLPDYAGHPLFIHHPAFAVLPAARPALGVNIVDGVVTGFIGWVTSRYLASHGRELYEAHPLHQLLDLKGLDTEPPDPGEIVGGLAHGRLLYLIDPVDFLSGPFLGKGAATLRDEEFSFDGGFDVGVKGLPRGARLPLKRDAGGRLLAGKTFRFDRSMGAAGKLSGELTGTYADGHVDVRGTLRYDRSSPRVSGSVTVVLTDLAIAREDVRDKLGSDAPSAIEPAQPGDQLALTGWGQVDLAISEWLTGNAEVIVHPEGYVTARGEIVPTKVIPILRKRAAEKELLPEVTVSRTLPGFDALIADLAVTASLSVKGSASLGPGTMHDLRVSGLLSTHPGIVNRFDFSGVVSVPAVAEIAAVATGDVSARLVKTLKAVSAGVRVRGAVTLQMYAELAAAAGRRKSAGGDPEYYLEGHLDAAAALKLALSIAFTARLAFWEKHVPLYGRTFTIGKGGVHAGFSYVFGDPRGGGLTLTFERGDFDAGKFVTAVFNGETVEERKYKGKEEVPDPEAVSDVVNPGAPAPVQPPDPAVPPPPPGTPPVGLAKDFVAAFEMDGAHHALRVRLSDPPALEMESVLRPLLEKIRKAQRTVARDKALSGEERASRLSALARLEASALAVQDAAMKAARAPAYVTPQLPGFDELARLIQEYGDSYHVTDLGEALGRVTVDPGQPETILQAFPELQKEPAAVANVEALLDADVEPDVLAKIVLNVKRGWWDGRDRVGVARDLLRALRRMRSTSSSSSGLILRDLAVGGTMAKGAEFVVRYIDVKLGWGGWIAFEVTDDDEEGRRWDAWIEGVLYQFKAWGKFYEGTFLRQMRRDLDKVLGNPSGDAALPLHWVFDGRLDAVSIQASMEAALDKAAADPANKHGYTRREVAYLRARLPSIIRVVKW